MDERFYIKKLSDVGTKELFISRLLHFQQHILQGLVGTKNKEEIQQGIIKIIFNFDSAFRSLRELRKEWSDEKIPENKKRQHIENIYSYLTIAFKDQFREVAKLMGYKIGFLFQNDRKFEAICAKFLKLHPKIDQQIIGVFKDDRRTWLTKMISVRNNLIEHSAGKDRTLIASLEQHMTLDAVELFFDNCWRSIEDYLGFFAINNTDPKYGLFISEIPEYCKDKNHHHRFGWMLKKAK